MKMREYKCHFLFFVIFAVHFLYTADSYANNTHSHASSWIIHELKTGHYNQEILINGNNPIQLVNYRTARPGHFVKILFTGISSLLAGLRYLKHNLKNINSEYARFLKLLLFPNHVFW